MERESADRLLLATKLAIPSIYQDKLIPRQQLYRQLDLVIQHPLLWIAAPAGFGKTTLVAAWLREVERRAAWISFAATENEPTLFWRYMLAALTRLSPTLAQQMPCWSIASTLSDHRQFLTQLINALLNLDEDVVLVLDNYHMITDPTIQQSMAFFIEYLPPRLHLVCIARTLPAPALARLRVESRLQELRAADLRLTLEEVRALLVLHADADLSDLSEQHLKILYEQTEGWMTGLQFIISSLRERRESVSTIEAVTALHPYIDHYFSTEIFTSQHEDMQIFLLETAVLERFSPLLCMAVTGRKNSEELLEQLAQHNIFLQSLDEQAGWYRYEPLWRDFLRRQLHLRDPQHEGDLHLRASCWYELHGLLDDAIYHVLEAGCIERSATLFEAAAWFLLQQRDHATIYHWLKQLPRQIFEQRPVLSYLYASVSLSLASMEEYEYYLQQAQDCWQVEQNLPMLACVHNLRASVARLRDDPYATRLHAQHTLELAGRDDIVLRASALVNLEAANLQLLPIPASLPSQTLRSNGVMQVTTPLQEQSGIRKQIQNTNTLKLEQKSEYIAVQLHAHLLRGYRALLRGDLALAIHIYHQALKEGENQEEHYPWYRLIAHDRLAAIYYEWNDLERCQEHWQHAARMIERGGGVGVNPWQHFLVGAQLAWYRGELDTIMPYLDQAEQTANRFGKNWSVCAEILERRVQFLLRMQNTPLARACLVHIAERSESSELLPFEQEANVLARARVLLAENQPESAIVLLEALLPDVRAQGRRPSELTLLLLLTQAYNMDGRAQQTLRTLEQALQLGETNHAIRTFIDEGPVIAALLSECYHRVQRRYGNEQATISPAYLSRLLLATGQTIPPACSRIHTVPLIEMLSEREYAVLRLIGEGLSNQEIASQLVVTVSTIKTHLNNIYAKLHVHTRLQAVTKAYNLGLLNHRESSDAEPLISRR